LLPGDELKDDTALIREMADEQLKEKAFLILVARYKLRIYHHVKTILHHHDDAHDAAQNTFIKLWEKHHTYKGNSAVYTWLYRIASNEALSMLRKRRNAPQTMNDGIQELPETGLFHQTQAGSIEQKLEKAIRQLPHKQRLVFCLRYFQNLSYAELSSFLNTSESALKASYHFALKKIEKSILKDAV
jgi:RNA polymerase sigma factor (sigma-70 family)